MEYCYYYYWIAIANITISLTGIAKTSAILLLHYCSTDPWVLTTAATASVHWRLSIIDWCMY